MNREWEQMGKKYDDVRKWVRSLVDNSYEFYMPSVTKLEKKLYGAFCRTGKRALIIVSAKRKGTSQKLRLYKFNGEYVLVEWVGKGSVKISFSRKVERWLKHRVLVEIGGESKEFKKVVRGCRNVDRIKAACKEYERWVNESYRKHGRTSFVTWLMKRPCMAPTSRSLLRTGLGTSLLTSSQRKRLKRRRKPSSRQSKTPLRKSRSRSKR